MLTTIISGGQSGVDRAALDVALQLNLACRGWCPRGRLSEQGQIPNRYPLEETPSADPAQRTKWNVRDADATLILAAGVLAGGTALARDCAVRQEKPHLVVDPTGASIAVATEISEWLDAREIRILNVAGPRESASPGIYDAAAKLLRAVLAE